MDRHEGGFLWAEAVCKRLLALSRAGSAAGSVHSVFARAVNIALDGREGLIGIVSCEKGHLPYAVSVRTGSPLDEIGIRAGMAAGLERGRLTLPEAGVSLDLAAAEPTELSLDAVAVRCGAEELRAGAEAIRRVLASAGAEAQAGLAPLATGAQDNVYTAFLRPRIPELLEAADSGDAERSANAAGRIAGCGAGLTPSSDDLLCGYFAAARLLARLNGKPERAALIPAMARRAADKTNRISATFLLQSGEGLAGSGLAELLQSIFSGGDGAAVQSAANKVLSIGSTSGGDTLTGVWLALSHQAGGI